MVIMRKGLKAKIIESHRPIKSLMDFKKKWESTKGCSNAEGLLSNIDELLKGKYQKPKKKQKIIVKLYRS